MGSMHQFQKYFEESILTSTVSGLKTPEGLLFGAGTTVGNGIEGWAPGAFFMDTDASAGSQWYRNTGTKTSATWTLAAEAAANITVADAGSLITATTVEAALAEAFQHIQSAQATMDIPLGAFTLEDGTGLLKQASTVTGWAQISNKEIVILIPVNAASGEDALQATINVPQDLDESKDVVVHVLCGKNANNDALTLDCEVYPCAAGDVGNADIQDTAAATVTQAAVELAFTCGADGVLAAPGTMTIILTQGGTNDGDQVYIYGAWIEYTRKTLTS